MHDLNSPVTIVPLLAMSARSVSENGTGADMRDYIGKGKVILDAALGSGTTPTLNVKLQHSDDDGSTDTYTDITDGDFDEVTGAAGNGVQEKEIDLDAVRRYVRAVATIAGTNYPTFSCNCIVLAKKQVL